MRRSALLGRLLRRVVRHTMLRRMLRRVLCMLRFILRRLYLAPVWRMLRRSLLARQWISKRAGARRQSYSLHS